MLKDEALFKTLMDSLHEGVYFVDPQRKIQYWNLAAEKITGFSAEEVMGRCCADNILIHVDDEGRSLCQGLCPLAATMRDGKGRDETLYLHHKDGHRLPVRTRVSAVHDEEGIIVGGIETFSDASTEVSAFAELDELKQAALMCSLTGVGNRRYTEKELQRELTEIRGNSSHLTVLFIDIDHFKSFNDKYGHAVGDIVLKLVAKTMSKVLRSCDFLGRWGGEEFVVILPRLKPSEIDTIANRMRALVEKTSRDTSKGKIAVTISVGAYLCDSQDTLETVVKSADELMYVSKNQGRNRVTSNALQRKV
jgi:diguanylate cyclase (GGDEF)-like protein/PAS domain S-box-containing protein